MSKIYLPTKDTIQRASDCLHAGQLVGVPTETVYGLAASALNPEAVAKIFAAKGRPTHNPLIVHVADVQSLESLVAQPLATETKSHLAKVIDLWPGPLTVVLPRNRTIPDIVTAGRDTVAIRIPNHPVMQQLLRTSGLPLAAPSANRSMYVSPTSAQHVADGLNDAVAIIIDGGACDVGLESTIVSLIDKPRLLRPGIITAEELAERFSMSMADLTNSLVDSNVVESVASASPDACDQAIALEAPGMMSQHYSPHTPLLFAGQPLPANLPRVGRIAFAPLAQEQRNAYVAVDVLSQHGNAHQIAQSLFAALRRFDAMQLDAIVIDTLDEHGVGRAIMDRLNRAAAR